MTKRIILVVDDEREIRHILRTALEREAFRVREAGSLHQMWQSIDRDGMPDLLLLDLNLPDGDGLNAASQITSKIDIPIIILSGRGSTVDKVTGLELGADDYISKPFELSEVVARVKSVLRRTVGNTEAHQHTEDCYQFGAWHYDAGNWKLTHPQHGEAALTQFEAKLLHLFLEGRGQALSRQFLADELGGRDYHPLDRSIDNLVSRLRKKLSVDGESGARIRAVRGVGYQFLGDVRVLEPNHSPS